MQSLDQLLEYLSERFNGRVMKLNAQRVCRFTVHKEITVAIEEGRPADHFYFYSTVGASAEAGPEAEALYARLLKAQLFNAELGEGMSFGLDKSAGEILLQQRVGLQSQHQNLTGEEFYRQLAQFVAWAMHWKKGLAVVQDASAAAADAGSSASIEHFIRA